MLIYNNRPPKCSDCRWLQSDFRVTFPRSMHRSSGCIISELQSSDKRLKTDILWTNQIYKMCQTFLSDQQWTDCKPVPVLLVGLAESETNTVEVGPHWALNKVLQLVWSLPINGPHITKYTICDHDIYRMYICIYTVYMKWCNYVNLFKFYDKIHFFLIKK